MSSPQSENTYLTAPLVPLFWRTALPIMAMMMLNGLISVVDAILLGRFVGAEALVAVTQVFPALLLVYAATSLVSAGMASRLARQMGAGDMMQAQATLSGAHGLALAIWVVLGLAFLSVGGSFVTALAGGPGPVADMGHLYLAIVVGGAPLGLVLAVQSDALRVEGRVGVMALAAAGVSVGNALLTTLFIAGFGWGVAGSALGTLAAQGLALAWVLIYRGQGRARLPLRLSLAHAAAGWGRMLALGAPQSLGLLGTALIAGAIVAMTRATMGEAAGPYVAAYGILMRIMSMSFLGLLGMSQALQAIAGNTYGARQWDRNNAALRLACLSALLYGVAVIAVVTGLRVPLAGAFVDDPAVVAAFSRIAPFLVIGLVTGAPTMMLGAWFQSAGEAARAGVISLARPYLFTFPLILVLPWAFGADGIWFAAPVAEALMLIVTLSVLLARARKRQRGWAILHLAP